MAWSKDQAFLVNFSLENSYNIIMKPTKKTKDISPEKLKELKTNAFNILTDVRRQLLTDYPFLGSIAMSMNLIPVRDVNLTTAATDGSSLYFDIAFLSELTNEERIFVFAHEVWHAAMCHFVRKETRQAKLFNIAADLEVNQLLDKDGFKLIKNCMMPNMFKFAHNLSAEQYYELLEKQANKIMKQMKQQMSKGSKGKDSKNQAGSEQDSGKGKKQKGNKLGDGQSGNGEPSENGQLSSGSGDGNEGFDKHIYKNEESSGNSNGTRSDKYGTVGNDPDFVPKVSEEAESNMKSSVSLAAQQVEKMRGELPAHYKGVIDKLLKPSVNWKEALQNFVTKTVDNKVNWSIPNRRYVSRKLYLPSHDGDMIRLGVIIDTSGSTAADLPRFLTELNAIVQSFSSYEITVIQCDAKVQEVVKYDLDNPFKVEQYEIKGFGGTMLGPAFNHILENNIEVDGIVAFTDGYFEPDLEPDMTIPTLWLITKDGTEDVVKFGTVIKMDGSKEQA